MGVLPNPGKPPYFWAATSPEDMSAIYTVHFDTMFVLLQIFVFIHFIVLCDTIGEFNVD